MIRAQELSKRYTVYDKPLDRLRDWVTPKSSARGRPFWALKDVSLEVAAGVSLGVVGVNGAGKSTLLKLLTATTVPTSGTFSVEGRVAALLELGMGFHPEFTGRENIEFNGKLLGMSDAEMAEKTPAIIDFAELKDFIDQPLRTYSSGMAMRLAFSVASSVEPDVLIIDEALSVGDLHFQQKCLARIRRFHEAGVTILFVSHDPALIKSFCNQAILLDAGKLVDQGKPDQVLDYYNALLAEKYRDNGSRAQIIRPRAIEPEAETDDEQSAAENPETVQQPEGHRAGNFRAQISRVWIDAAGVGGNSSLLTPGMPAKIVVRVAALENVESPTVGIMIKDRLGNEVHGVNTALRGHSIGSLAGGEAVEIEFSAPMNLGEGLYSITAAAHQGADHTEVCYDWIERAATFQVVPSPSERFTGVCRLEMEISHRRDAASAEELEVAKNPSSG